MKKNDVVDIEITDSSFDGQGIGRSKEGIVVFVKNALPGEIVKAHILKVLKNTAYGKVSEFIKKSEKRCEPVCKSFLKCGGCTYMFTDYQTELEIKTRNVKNALKTIAGLECDADFAVGGEEYCYRNKMLVPVSKDKNGKIYAGFFRKNSHDAVPMSECPISHPDFKIITDAIIGFCEKYCIEPYNEEKTTGIIRHIYIRRGFHTGEIMAGVVTKTKSLPNKDKFIAELKKTGLNIVSIIQNINEKNTNVILGEKTVVLDGKPYIEDFMLKNRFRISCPSFYQVNTAMAERLYEIALKNMDENDRVIFDLYSGAGTITLAIAKKAKNAEKVIGIESCEPAVLNARENAKINGIKNVEFICGKAEEEIFSLLNVGIMPDAVILDPPRSGCDKMLIKALCRLKPQKIIYISCNPSTMARDIKLLSDVYNLNSVCPVDLFPKTYHIETVAFLSRQPVDEHIYFDVNVGDLPKTARTTDTYPEIKAYIKDKYGFEKRENYNKGKDNHRVPNCPPEKEKAVRDAFKHFGML